MMVVPIDTPGVTMVRNLPVFGDNDREGYAEILFEDVEVPRSALLGGEGDGFAISQARLGPDRIHHCMRSIRMAERALEGTALGKGDIQDWIAESRIEMIRLLTLKTAWLMETVGNQEARTEIAAIKVAAPPNSAQSNRPRHPFRQSRIELHRWGNAERRRRQNRGALRTLEPYAFGGVSWRCRSSCHQQPLIRPGSLSRGQVVVATPAHRRLIGLRQAPSLPSKSALGVHLSRAPTLAIEATPAAPAAASWRPFH
jgi:hypothetical protein